MIRFELNHRKGMATSSFSVVVSLSLSLFLVLLTKGNADEAISFKFNKFDPSNIILQGDAAIASTSGKLQLTRVNKKGIPISASLGRALYALPIRIWDKETGNVASWATSFKFNIFAPNKSNTADGLAFFLAPVGSQPKGKGGFLGLFNNYTYDDSLQTVAVEFDTFSNQKWDPEYRHIGIDVNCIKSIRTASWGLANGQPAEILITYDASTSLLVASLVHPSRRTSYIVSERVYLKSVLPEWVSIGFSATTGLREDSVEIHDVLSWYFVSQVITPDQTTTLDVPSSMLHGAF